MRKALQIISFLLVLSFLLYLVPPVRNYVNTTFQAQLSEFVQVEPCGCTEDSPEFFCIQEFVPIGTCPSSDEEFLFDSPTVACQTPGDQLISYVYSEDECVFELGGILIEENTGVGYANPVNEYGPYMTVLSPIEGVSVLDGQILVFGEPISFSDEGSVSFLSELLYSAVEEYYETVEIPSQLGALISIEDAIGFPYDALGSINPEFEAFLYKYIDSYYYGNIASGGILNELIELSPIPSVFISDGLVFVFDEILDFNDVAAVEVLSVLLEPSFEEYYSLAINPNPSAAVASINEALDFPILFGATVNADFESYLYKYANFYHQNIAFADQLVESGSPESVDTVSTEEIIELTTTNDPDLGAILKNELEEGGILDLDTASNEEIIDLKNSLEEGTTGINPEDLIIEKPASGPEVEFEAVNINGFIVVDPAGEGFEKTKELVTEQLDKIDLTGKTKEEISAELLELLGLQEPLLSGMRKVLDECINDALAKLDETGATTGSAPVPETGTFNGEPVIEEKEAVFIGGQLIIDPAGAGFDQAKPIVEAALENIDIEGQNLLTIYPALLVALDLSEPIAAGMKKLLEECIKDALAKLDETGATTGSAPESESPGGVIVAGNGKISLNGKEYDLSVDDDVKVVKKLLEEKIRELLLSDFAYKSLLGLLGLEPPLDPSLEELIRACLRFFGDTTGLGAGDNGTSTTGGNTVGGTVVDGGTGTGGDTNTGGGITLGPTTTGEGTDEPGGGTTPPEEPIDPPPTGDPPVVPPTEIPPTCPPEEPIPPDGDPLPIRCPGLHLWDAGAAHDGGVPTHYEWDGPHFHVGRLNPDIFNQTFIKIEEPVVWLGQGDKRVDGELEPHCCDDENASIDQDGLIHAKSNQDGITVYLDHIIGAAANPANPPTTHLGTLIVARYEQRGSQNYDFFVIDAIPVRSVGEKYVAVNNNPLRTNPDLLKGEGWLRVIYMAADEENYGFKVEEIEDDWDGTHSKLMEIINLPAFDPFDPSIPPGEIEDYWYGEDCGGNFGFYDPMQIPACNQEQDIVVEPGLDDKLNITFICTQTQTQTCGNDNSGGAGTFGGGNNNNTPANNGPLGDYLVTLLKQFKSDPANNTAQNRLELMYQFMIAVLPAVGNNPTP